MTRPSVLLLFVAISILGALASPNALLAGELEASDAWIRLPPPGNNAAGYITIYNPDAEPRRIVGISSDAAARTELHRSWIEDGVARMRKVESVEVPAHGSIEFAPKGLHVMLIRPQALREGQIVTLRFVVEGHVEGDAEAAGDDVWVVQVEVRRDHGANPSAH